MLLGVDVGGTFTDAVLFDGRRLHTAKLPTTPADQSEAVTAAVEEVLRRAGADAAGVEVLAHGMTVGTNALLEERGARTALIATRGFGDVLEIARQDRPELYRLCTPKATPLVAPELRFEAAERTGPEGTVEPLADDEPERLARLVEESGAEAVVEAAAPRWPTRARPTARPRACSREYRALARAVGRSRPWRRSPRSGARSG